MLAGAAIVFFAYIGFDSVSTHAEEARNPSRDVPIGIMTSLVLCTVLVHRRGRRAHRHGAATTRSISTRRSPTPSGRSACRGRSCWSRSAPSPASPRCCW